MQKDTLESYYITQIWLKDDANIEALAEGMKRSGWI